MTVPKESWKMFNRISPSYDRINRILSLGMDQTWRRLAASHLPKKPDLRLLDLASGTGDQLIACLEYGKSIQQAIGIDLSEEMLRIAKEKMTAKSYKDKISFMTADAEKIPFPDASFDAATFSFGIRNVSDPLLSLRQIKRVLKPQGKCLILEFSLPPQPFKQFHLFYLRHILPRIGGWLSKNPDAYRYLNQTIETFPYGKAFCSLMETAGFTSIQTIPMALGAVTLYVGETPC